METVNKPNDQEPEKLSQLLNILANELVNKGKYNLNGIYSKPLPETWCIGIGILCGFCILFTIIVRAGLIIGWSQENSSSGSSTSNPSTLNRTNTQFLSSKDSSDRTSTSF